MCFSVLNYPVCKEVGRWYLPIVTVQYIANITSSYYVGLQSVVTCRHSECFWRIVIYVTLRHGRLVIAVRMKDGEFLVADVTKRQSDASIIPHLINLGHTVMQCSVLFAPKVSKMCHLCYYTGLHCFTIIVFTETMRAVIQLLCVCSFPTIAFYNVDLTVLYYTPFGTYPSLFYNVQCPL